MKPTDASTDSADELIELVKDIAISALHVPRKDHECPKCGGDLSVGRHSFDADGGAPDCSWLYCLDCNYQTDPE